MASKYRIFFGARGEIEVVIGGGIKPTNVAEILQKLPLDSGPISVHAFSGVQENGETTERAVRSLADAVHTIQLRAFFLVTIHLIPHL